MARKMPPRKAVVEGKKLGLAVLLGGGAVLAGGDAEVLDGEVAAGEPSGLFVGELLAGKGNNTAIEVRRNVLTNA